MKVLSWIKNNQIELIIILLIIILAAFLRFYQIDQYMTFLGDEGRDALVIKKLLTEFDVPFIGPPTSVGNMYLGPLYYYMMAVPMTIFWLNPVAAAGMVAIIGTLTVGLMYYLAREWFGKGAAISVAILYALSPVAITYSKSSWNPNPAPFFTLLMILGFHLARKSHNYWWLIVSGGAIAFAIQMHYLALILLPIGFVLWLHEFINRQKNTHFWQGTIGAVFAFLVLMSPLVVFDIKHNFMNAKAFQSLLFSKDSSVGFNFMTFLEKLQTIYQYNLIERYISGPNVILLMLTIILVAVPIFWMGYIQRTQKKFFWPMYVLASFLVLGLMGLSLYKQEIYDHYVGFLSPVPFLLLGANFYFINSLKSKYKKSLLSGLGVFVLILVVANIFRSPLGQSPNNQLRRTQQVAQFVIDEAQNKPFNFALISERNYDAAYQFYLGQYGHPPKVVPAEKTDQLFVVCEDKECNPVGHPKYEIAAFGWSLVESEKNIDGVKVFKLIPNPAQPNSGR